MKSRKKIIYAISIALGLVVITVFVGITAIVPKWNQPFSEGLELPTYAPTMTVSQPGSKQGISDDVQNPEPKLSPTDALQGIKIARTATPNPPSFPTPAPLCGGPPVMTILGVGIDTLDENYYYGLGDVIRILRVDFVAPKVTVLSLPRDIWVEIPEISDHYGITHGKLNQSYFYGTGGMGYYDGPGQGPGLMALTLVKNFDLYVDHYGTVNMATMARIIDAVGGIDIYLPEDVDGRSADGEVDYGYFEAGNQHLTGEAAIRFSRIRMLDSDIHRIDRQTQVLYALREKILSPSVLPRIPKLITSFRDAVITDLSPGDFAALTCLLPHITKEKLVFTNLPDSLLSEDYQYDPHRKNYVWVFRADFEAIRKLLGYFQSGDWPVK